MRPAVPGRAGAAAPGRDASEMFEVLVLSHAGRGQSLGSSWAGPPRGIRLAAQPGQHTALCVPGQRSGHSVPRSLNAHHAPRLSGERPAARRPQTLAPAGVTMSVSSTDTTPSLTQEILSHLGLATKTAAWGTLGTLRTFLSFSVDKDVQRLLTAITGQGVDGRAIVDVLTSRSREQRLLISRAFQERTQQELLSTLRAALSGPLEKLVVALLQPEAQLDAQELRTALKDLGSANDVAVEILATRSSARLQECLAVYRCDFQAEAEEDIRSEASGLLQDLLLALAKGDRDSCSGIIDYNLTAQDVQALRQAEGGNMEATWVPILTQRSREHLVRVFDQYQRHTGHAVERSIQDHFQGTAQAALLSLVSALRNTPLYFADKLHQALQEPELKSQVLTRILVSRSETDLLSIRAEFRKRFGKSLYSSLQDTVTGDYRSALLGLCRAEDV